MPSGDEFQDLSMISLAPVEAGDDISVSFPDLLVDEEHFDGSNSFSWCTIA
ncbi:fungal mating type pheromone precursor [Phlebiopsis gigantea 11061_1 CR5-6]|uniref:Fungal mating type pheromone n=1 Tax=Phlebiopsis gigantea (strain 11061_1 CR5-6) TaxID=745531 RepID=A0A0C3RPF3_PHLG1|nr:fungal mating type pheromone precursor [Phlebiopsis gigantea 11061_1 CR5-6]